MKTNKIFQFLTIGISVVAFAFFVSCEGPVGPVGPIGLAGTDGTDGVDGNVTCLACHSTGNIQNVKEQFSQSVHSAGQVAVDYAGGRASCARCHSSEGFIEYAANGTVAENISAPSAWECKTCHDIHETFDEVDFASILRLADPIAFIFDEAVTADFGNSNLCANCHQSRRAEPNTTDPGATFAITSTHYGPHHGAQSNVLYGVGFAQIVGSMSYPAAGSATHMTAETGKCTGCHMATYGNGQGGHTFNPAIDACTECHAGATDFDINGVRTAIATQLDELRDLLVVRGVLVQAVEDIYELNPETGNIDLVTVIGGYHPVVGTYSMAEAQAFFNWTGLDEDRSQGVHNPAYVKALLTNSIEALQ